MRERSQHPPARRDEEGVMRLVAQRAPARSGTTTTRSVCGKARSYGRMRRSGRVAEPPPSDRCPSTFSRLAPDLGRERGAHLGARSRRRRRRRRRAANREDRGLARHEVRPDREREQREPDEHRAPGRSEPRRARARARRAGQHRGAGGRPPSGGHAAHFAARGRFPYAAAAARAGRGTAPRARARRRTARARGAAPRPSARRSRRASRRPRSR